jgi:hypothetical protein
MPTDISAAMARTARERAQTETKVIDVNVAAVATVWLVFYFILVVHAFTNQSFAAAIELTALY